MKSYTKNLFRFTRAVCCGLLLFSSILGNKAWAIVEVNPEDVIVEPMITTHWYQMDPYWDLVPRYEDTGLQHYSGCLAPAVASVMRFWEWPVQGRGVHTNAQYPKQTVDFTKTVYDWKNMIDDYDDGEYTQEQGNAVAELIRDINAATNSSYGHYTASELEMLPRALIGNFGYKTTVRLVERENYQGDWNALIRAELDAGRPVLFYSPGLGEASHCFIIDGYAKDNHFHINFVWAGSDDGYYTLDDIDTGGDYVYNENQVAVVGIEPERSGTFSDHCLAFAPLNDKQATVTAYVNSDDSEMPATITIPQSVTIGGKEYQVTEIGYGALFRGTQTTVELPSTVERIHRSAFSYCKSMKSVNIPDAVKLIGMNAFYQCSNLLNLVINNSVEEIGDGAFFACSKIKDVTLPATLNKIGKQVFAACGRCKNIQVDAANQKYCSVDGVVYSKDKKSLWIMPTSSTELTILEGTERIEEYACANSALQAVHIPASVNYIGSNAFSGDDMMTDLYDDALKPQEIDESVLPNYHIALHVPESAENAYDLAEYWKYLVVAGHAPKTLRYTPINDSEAKVTDILDPYMEYVEIPATCEIDGKTYKVTEISDGALTGFAPMKELVVGDEVTYIGVEAFANSGVEKVSLGEKVEIIADRAFAWCSSLKSIVIPDAVKSLGSGAFRDCMSLADVSIGNGVETIGDDAFIYCQSLTNLTLGNSLQEIGNSAFSHYDAYPLKTLVIPNSVKRIGRNAFFGSANVESLTLGSGIEEIGTYAFSFYDFSNLKDVYNLSAVPLVTTEDIFFHTQATLHVPAGTKNLYEVADVWKNFQVIVDDQPTGINQLFYHDKKTDKIFQNGELLIRKNSVLYNLNGTRVFINE
ncbi:MAG: leucine-rich repeat protein [Bacteroidaceae bacterium]|nr:leucine-rich repeat protein [Bacteroidaceae bacterium]